MKVGYCFNKLLEICNILHKNIGMTPFLALSLLKSLKKEDSPKTPNQHNES